MTSTILLWFFMPWRPRLSFSLASLKRLGGFAGNVFGENLIAQSFRTAANLLIGRVLGAAAVGTYTLATNVILVPFTRIAGPLQQVFFPAFSRINDDRERLADMWIRATRVIALIAMPALVGLIVVAPDFVDVALGPRWADTTVIIQILGSAGLLAALQTLNPEVLLALGKAGTLFRLTIVSVVAAIIALLIGMEWGLVGVAVANLIVTVVIEPTRAYITARALGIPLWRFVRPMAGIAQATALMAVAVLVLRELMVAGGVPSGARLAACVAVGGIVYVPCCLWRASDVTDEILAVLRRRRPAAPAVAPIAAVAESEA